MGPSPPVLLLVTGAVAGGVVGRGVGAHAVGHGLDERRSLTRRGAGEGEPGCGEDGQNVVAVDLDPGDAVALPALGDGGMSLDLDRFGDGPLVVLAEEHDRDDEAGGEAEGLGHVAFAGRAVAEVGHRGGRSAVQLDPEGIAGGVEHLGPDDDRRRRHVVRRGVPSGERGASPQPEHRRRVDTAAVGDAMLPIAPEHEVVGAQRPCRPDLRRFLPEQGGPQRQLTLALQRHRLGVEAADDGHVGVEALQLLGAYVGDQVPVGASDGPLPVHGDQLDETVERDPFGDPSLRYLDLRCRHLDSFPRLPPGGSYSRITSRSADHTGRNDTDLRLESSFVRSEGNRCKNVATTGPGQLGPGRGLRRSPGRPGRPGRRTQEALRRADAALAPAGSLAALVTLATFAALATFGAFFDAGARPLVAGLVPAFAFDAVAFTGVLRARLVRAPCSPTRDVVSLAPVRAAAAMLALRASIRSTTLAGAS